MAARSSLPVPADVGRSPEVRLAANALASEGLVVALEQLGSPAFVADGHGRPVYANTLGLEMFDRDPSGLTESLRSKIIRAAPEVREIRAPGLRPHWLVVLSKDDITPSERIAMAARVWGLTPRQADVLGLVARGDANKIIAAKLACAEVTIECHLTALFRKAGVDNRAQLVSRFWTL